MRSPRGLAAIAGLALTFAAPAIPAAAAPLPPPPPRPRRSPPELPTRPPSPAPTSSPRAPGRPSSAPGSPRVAAGSTTPPTSALTTACRWSAATRSSSPTAPGASTAPKPRTPRRSPCRPRPRSRPTRRRRSPRPRCPQWTARTAPKLVVLAGDAPKLAYEVVVSGHNGATPTQAARVRRRATGAVLDTRDDVREAGTGNAYYAGTVSIDTSGSGSSYSMTDPARPRHRLRPPERRRVFTRHRHLGQRLRHRPRDRLRRHALRRPDAMEDARRVARPQRHRRPGGGFRRGRPQRRQRLLGRLATPTSATRRTTAPGDPDGRRRPRVRARDLPDHPGRRRHRQRERRPQRVHRRHLRRADRVLRQQPERPAGLQVGEGVNLVGHGPIRYMYNPSQVGDPNCYSAPIPSTEVHAAAGPQNHWFYLLAEGSSPTGGKPASPTCNNSTVTGIGIQKAGKIFYNGLLQKTSSWNHRAAREAHARSRRSTSSRAAAPSSTRRRPRGTR